MKALAYKKFTLINLFFAFSVAAVGSLLAPYLQEQGFLDWQISLMFTVFPFVNIIFLPVFGRIADRLNRQVVIWFGLVIEITALVLYLLSSHWAIVILARLFDGLAVALVALILLAKVEDSIKQKNRGQATGKFLSLSYIGTLIGPLAGGLIADYYFIQTPFMVSAVILAILAIFLLFDRSQAFRHIKLRLTDLSWWSEIKLFLSHQQLKGMGILGMVMHAAQPAMRVFLPLFIIDRLGMTYSAIGVAMFVHGITHLGQGVLGRLSDKLGHWKMVVWGVLLAALGIMLIGLVKSYLVLIIVLFFIGIGSSMWNVAAWSLMSDIGEREAIEAQVLTSYVAIAKVGALISFVASAWLVKQFGLPTIFLINGAVIILGLLYALKYVRFGPAKV